MYLHQKSTPTQNKINKKEVHNQLHKFFRCIKLTAHFHDTTKQADLSNKEYRFKGKNKHWVPTKIHHALDTFMEATKKDINEQLTKILKSSYNRFFKRELFPETFKYWVGVQWGQSYLMGRRCIFGLGLPPFWWLYRNKNALWGSVLHQPALHPIFSYWVG